MPLKMLRKPGFYYIAYCRRDIDDFVEFKTTLDVLSKKDAQERDIIVDLTRGDSLSDGEFSVLANVIKKLLGTKRFLRVVVNEAIKAKLESTNLLLAGNGAVYGNHIELFESLSQSLAVATSEKEHASEQQTAAGPGPAQ
jgi:hypothetical protein